MLPLDNTASKHLNSDYDWFYSHEEKLLKRYLADLHMDAPPATLRDYLAKVVTPTLERQKQQGAVALKLEAAYLRPLNFAQRVGIGCRARLCGIHRRRRGAGRGLPQAPGFPVPLHRTGSRTAGPRDPYPLGAGLR